MNSQGSANDRRSHVNIYQGAQNRPMEKKLEVYVIGIEVQEFDKS